MKVTRWSPDTCECILEYEWDETEDEGTRLLAYKKTIKTCPEHGALVGQSLYDQVLSENTRKNFTLGEIQKVSPEADTENYLWFFDKNRILQVSLIGIDVPQATKQELQATLDERFNGKVKVL